MSLAAPITGIFLLSIISNVFTFYFLSPTGSTGTNLLGLSGLTSYLLLSVIVFLILLITVFFLLDILLSNISPLLFYYWPMIKVFFWFIVALSVILFLIYLGMGFLVVMKTKNFFDVNFIVIASTIGISFVFTAILLGVSVWTFRMIQGKVKAKNIIIESNEPSNDLIV
jgi:hypothetical protein